MVTKVSEIVLRANLSRSRGGFGNLWKVRGRTSRSTHPKNTNARSLHRGRWFTSLLALSVLLQRRLRRR
jgi:hypothetical protein